MCMKWLCMWYMMYMYVLGASISFATSVYHGIILPMPVPIHRKGPTMCCGVYVHEMIMHVVHVGMCDVLCVFIFCFFKTQIWARKITRGYKTLSGPTALHPIRRMRCKHLLILKSE